MSASVDELRVRRDVLEIAWNEMDSFIKPRGDDEDPISPALEGDLSDGRRFVADTALFTTGAVLDAHYWSITTPGLAPTLWLSRIHGLGDGGGLATNGNLSISQDRVSEDGSRKFSGSHGHFRFRGAHTYYLFKRRGDEPVWFLAVDTGSAEPPDRKDVYPDVLALQFVLGRAFYFDVLHGIDGSDVVALVGGRHGRDHSHRPNTQPPVPINLARECWPPQLFELLSEAYRTRRELRLYIVLSFYLDALASFHVEGRYLALHVALESFAYWALQAEGTEDVPLVDRTKWSPWLRDNKEAIRSLAMPGQGESLFAKITSIPARRASSRVVEEAFRITGLSLTAEMAAELEEGRGGIVHTAVMFEERQQLDAYLQPIALVRAMLVALVARVVGYKGEIVGWTRERGRPYDAADPAWWPIDPAAASAALANFQIEGRLPET